MMETSRNNNGRLTYLLHHINYANSILAFYIHHSGQIIVYRWLPWWRNTVRFHSESFLHYRAGRGLDQIYISAKTFISTCSYSNFHYTERLHKIHVMYVFMSLSRVEAFIPPPAARLRSRTRPIKRGTLPRGCHHVLAHARNVTGLCKFKEDNLYLHYKGKAPWDTFWSDLHCTKWIIN